MSFAAKLARLEELRRGLATMAAPSRVERPRSTLPFDAIAGPAHRRRRTVPSGEHVGSVPLTAALGVDPLVLSLLALTPAIARCSMDRALFLDIETTGFGNGTGNYAFLVGLAFFDRGSLELEQYLLRDPCDEEPLLAHVAGRMQAAELIVTYNGKSFDGPVLRSRFVMSRRPAPPERPQLDLLHVARRVHKSRGFRKALGTLEQRVLGFWRGADISGAEVAARYAHFLHTGNDGELDEVVLHNERDVLTMVALTGLYGEPLERLPAEELAAAARVMQRAGDLDRAHAFADEAVRRNASAYPLRIRASIAKALGDRDRALSDFEELARRLDDPAVRLELAKLYEHHVKDPRRALEVVGKGTGEALAACDRRRARLMRKLVRSHPVPGWARVGR